MKKEILTRYIILALLAYNNWVHQVNSARKRVDICYVSGAWVDHARIQDAIYNASYGYSIFVSYQNNMNALLKNIFYGQHFINQKVF